MTDDDLVRSLGVPEASSTRRRVNGVALHVVEAGPTAGPPLILLHGFPEFWWGWRRQIGPLARAGHRVVVPDMRDYNLSDKPRGLPAYDLDVLAADVVALADACGAGGGAFRLVGHDWGGIVAWWAAMRRPERVERCVTMNAPHPDVWGTRIRRSPGQAVRSWYAGFFQIPWWPEAVLRADGHAALRRMMTATARRDAFAPGELDRYAEAWARPGALTAMLAYYRATRRPHRPPRRVRVPMLLLWGERDAFLQRAIAREGAALCDAGALVFVPGATHWAHLEEPRAVNAALVRFLGGPEAAAVPPL